LSGTCRKSFNKAPGERGINRDGYVACRREQGVWTNGVLDHVRPRDFFDQRIFDQGILDQGLLDQGFWAPIAIKVSREAG
jgi:hypothetical protein